MRVLVIEDDRQVRESLVQGLNALGYVAEGAADGEAGWALASEARHELIILDRMLPALDGLEVLRRLRRCGSSVPVLLLTARDGLADRVEGLDAGADDYLTKPFAVSELLARVRALLRRREQVTGPQLAVADLDIDTVTRSVRRRGMRIDLTPREYLLLDLLAGQAGKEVAPLTLAERIYDSTDQAAHNAVEVLVGRLRRKLQRDDWPPILHTRRGFGYRLGDG